jgi:hypothetical protein
MSSKDHSEKRKKDGRNRGVVLRHSAKKAGLTNRRVWLTKAEVPEFYRLIAPLGLHVLGLAAALDHHGSRSLERRLATRKPKGATPSPGPAAIPIPADASQVMKAEPAAPPAAATVPEPVDAPQPPKRKSRKSIPPHPEFPGFP